MASVAVRDLRNRTAEVVRSIEEGEEITLTNRGRPIARIVPIRGERRRYLTRSEVAGLPLADPGLRDDLRRLADEALDWSDPYAS